MAMKVSVKLVRKYVRMWVCMRVSVGWDDGEQDEALGGYVYKVSFTDLDGMN